MNSRTVNSMCKCNTLSFQGFDWGEESEALARPGVQPILNLKDLAFRDDIQIGAFRQEPADESVGVLHGRFFPGAAGIAEEGTKAEEGIQFTMEEVLKAVVVGDGFAERFGERREDVAEGGVRGQGGLVLDLGQAGEAGLAIDGDLEGGSAPAHDEVDFPMAGFQSQVGFAGSFVDGDAAQDEGLGAVDSMETPEGVLAGQAGDQVTGLLVDPLVDGLGADDFEAPLKGQFAGDDLGRPFEAKPALDLPSQGLSFEAGPAVALRVSQSGDELCPEGVVMLPGEVAAELPGEGGGRASEGPGSGPKGLSVLKHDGKDFSFFFVQMRVGVHRPPFYPETPPQSVALAH